MSQYQNNLGNTARLSRSSSFVSNQYGKLGAEGNFAEVFDSAKGEDADPDDSQLRIYNICTWLGGYNLPAVVTGRALTILGKLEYGIGNASMVVDFDWKVGTQISVAASFIRVKAAYSENGPNTPAEVVVGASVSSGSRAARAQVTRTYPQLIVNDDNAVLFPIPPMAHALNLFSSDPAFYTAGKVVVRFVGGASGGFSAASTDLVSYVGDGVPFSLALGNEDGVRFPESAKFVELSTAVAATDYHITPCFTLSV